jgi:hypothetical protein
MNVIREQLRSRAVASGEFSDENRVGAHFSRPLVVPDLLFMPEIYKVFIVELYHG